VKSMLSPCTVSYRRYRVDGHASHIVVLFEILAARLQATPAKLAALSTNFVQCAHDAHETLADFATRLLATTRERRLQNVVAAAAVDSDLRAQLDNVFGWPNLFDLELPMSPSTVVQPAHAPGAQTMPARKRFRRGKADDVASAASAPAPPAAPNDPPAASAPAPKSAPPASRASSGSDATNQTALSATAAQARLDALGATSGPGAGISATATTAPTSTAPEVLGAPTIDRSVFGSMLKRRRFDTPAAAAPALPPPVTPPATSSVPAPAAPKAPALPPPEIPVVPKPSAPPPPPLCDACDCYGHTAENCEQYPEARVPHPDALVRAAASPTHRDFDVRYDGGVVVINGMRFQQGYASGAGCNCLIDTLQQHLGVTVDARLIRERLQLLFQVEPDQVRAGNYLDFRAHSRTIIRLLGNAARRGGEPIDTSLFRVVCVDLDRMEHGDAVGDGDVTFYIARENGNHFVPLREL